MTRVPQLSHALAPARRRFWLALLAILLVAAGLRLWQLDRHGLWWDEGNNAYLAHAGLARVVEMSRLTNDTNPPAHRLALGLWLGLLGDGVLQLRLLSVVCGLGVVILAAYWGQRLAGPRAALLAAALMALAPMAVYYDREAKGYPWVALWGWVALTLLDRALLSGDRRPRGWRAVALWAGYALATALALGAHYYTALLILAQGLWLAGWLASARPGWRVARAKLLPWLAALCGVAALLAPWVALTWRTAFAGAQNVPMARGAWDLPTYLRYVGTTLAAGPYGPLPWAWLALGALLIPAGWEVYRGRGPRQGLLATTLLAPIAAGYAAQAITPFVIPRFFLYLLPALCVLAAAGLARLGRRALPLGLALLVAWAASLPHAYRPVALPMDDMRPLGDTLARLARPGDGVIVNYIWQEGMLRMYAPDASVAYYLGWFSEDTVAQEMAALAQRHPRLWLVTYQMPLQHPANPGGWWLEQHAARALVHEHGHNRAVLYEKPCEGVSVQDVATLAEDVHLSAAALPGSLSPGDTLPVTLVWRVGAPLQRPYTVFLQLLSPEGALVAQSDGDPRNGLMPLATLAPGASTRDCRALLVPPDAAPGRYAVIVGLYDRETGARAPVVAADGAAADHALLGTVLIER